MLYTQNHLFKHFLCNHFTHDYTRRSPQVNTVKTAAGEVQGEGTRKDGTGP